MKQKSSGHELQQFCGGLAAGLLALHFYYFCYAAFAQWHLTITIIDRFAIHMAGPLHHKLTSKLIILLLAIPALTTLASHAPASSKKRIGQTAAGIVLYFGGDALLYLDAQPSILGSMYIAATLAGLTILCIVLQPLASHLGGFFRPNVFNDPNETFPQQEKLISGPQFIHLPATYKLKKQTRKSILNLDPYPGTLIMGKPGSGKTRYLFRQLISQSLTNQMTLFVYDLKYPTLTRLTYNTLRNTNTDPLRPRAFYSLNFDDLSRSHRCNPIHPATLADISDAIEAARTMLLALNRKWIDMQGDFFCESATSFFAANIWFLREFEQGRYCTLPHLIELIQTPYHTLFSILRSYPTITTLINSFVEAYEHNTMEQLQGQVDSARIPLAALSSPKLYYLLSGNDLSLRINDPEHPKVLCIGSNPQKQHIYGVIVSLYVSTMLKLINRSDGLPCHVIADEFTSFYVPNMASTVAVGRENKVAITYGIQDYSQLRAEYGHNQADALFNLPGNIISGRVTGDSAKHLAENFPRIIQERTSETINSKDTSTGHSQYLDPAIPPGKIATLSSGEFVGITADTPSQPNDLKAFHCRIALDHRSITREEAHWQPLPMIREIDETTIQTNFERIKKEVQENIVAQRMQDIDADPRLKRLILTQNRPSQRQQRNPGKNA